MTGEGATAPKVPPLVYGCIRKEIVIHLGQELAQREQLNNESCVRKKLKKNGFLSLSGILRER